MLSAPSVTQAKLAKFKKVTSADIGTFSVDLHYKNVAAAKKFRFELWDKREGRTQYRKVLTFTKKRTSKTKKYFDLGLSNLKADRDYKIRYRPIYLGDRLGVWSNYRKFRTLKQAVYFTVDTTTAPAPDDTLYVVVDESSSTSATPGNYPLTTTDSITYTAEVEGVAADDVLRYVIARNLNSPSTVEEFTPDDPTHLRNVTVESMPTYADISVTDWRWYDASFTPAAGTVSSENWAVAPRSEFSLSFGLEKTYDDLFMEAASTVFADMTASGLTAVTLHYAPRMITAADTAVTTTQTVTVSPSENEMTDLVAAARAAGLEPILAIDFPIDPDNSTTIAADLAGTHSNSYLTGYLTRWREAMNDGVDYATAQGITTVVLATDFDDLTYTDDAQQVYISYIIEHDLMPVIGNGYSGNLTTANYNTDTDFTWYNAGEIDWIGDTWYPSIATTNTTIIADMYAEALADITTKYSAATTAYGKPIYLHQLGVMSFDGAASAGETVPPTTAGVDPTTAADDTYVRDYQEQADTYEALFRAIADTNYIIGVGSIDYTYFERHDINANIRGKVAELVWARWAQIFSAAL